MTQSLRPLAFQADPLAAGLRDRGLAGLLLTAPESVYYATGYPALPDAGNPILFALRNQNPVYAYVDASGHVTLIGWIGALMGFEFGADESRSAFDTASALDELREVLGARLPAEARIGIEASCPFLVLQVVLERVAIGQVVLAGDLLLTQRLRKSAAEIALIRQATAIIEAATTDLRDRLAVGASRLAVIAAAKRAMLAHGATGIDHVTIAFGGSNPEIAADEILAPNQLVTLDIGATVAGYASDNRRYVYSAATLPDELRTTQALMCAIVDQVAAAARPGKTFADLYATAVAAYEAHGLPPFFIAVGHSLGLEVEEASITAESQVLIVPAMVLNIELYTTTQDGTSIGDEETFLITDTGVERLTLSDPALSPI